MRDPAPPTDAAPVLVTGGAGFVGANIADDLLSHGQRVIVLDDLSREGAATNLQWLRERHGDAVEHRAEDVRDAAAVRRAVDEASAVYHLAAQVAVTTSLADPREDLGVNLQGTFNVLEALRRRDDNVPLVFASTNKVYGALGDLGVEAQGDRYMPLDDEVARAGISERRPLDFHSPYGCSKGAADQYVLDHARVYGMPNVVLRMSCVYGERQHGNEDQGWVAHFLRAAHQGAPLTIYGDGRQVRDVLHVADVVEAFHAARTAARTLSGRAFNLGGGPSRTLSLRELIARISTLEGSRPHVGYADWRAGDQPWYVSDTRAFTRATGWRPRVDLDEGLRRLHRWLLQRGPEASLARGRDRGVA